MSVKVIYDNYSDIWADYMYGKKFLELPEERKPKWLTWEEPLEYEKKMLQDKE